MHCSKKIEGYIASWEREYGKDPVRMTSGDRFAYVLKQAHKKYGLDLRPLYRIGVSFSSETGTVSDWEVKSPDLQ